MPDENQIKADSQPVPEPPPKILVTQNQLTVYFILMSAMFLAIIISNAYLFTRLPALEYQSESLRNQTQTAHGELVQLNDTLDARIKGLTAEVAELKKLVAEHDVRRPESDWSITNQDVTKDGKTDKNILGGVKLPSGISPEMMEKLMKKGATPEEEKRRIAAVVQTLPPAYVRDIITKLTDLSPDDIPSDDSKLSQYATKLFEVVSGETPASDIKPEGIQFSTTVSPDNSASAPQSIFKSNDKRIFACFSNTGALAGLTRVVSRWTNVTNNKSIEYLNTSAIDPNAQYNFIWVEKKKGWPIGNYVVELFSTQTMAKIAGGSFAVEQGQKGDSDDAPEEKAPKKAEPDNQGKKDGLEEASISLTGVKIGTMLEFLAMMKDRPVLCEDSYLEDATFDRASREISVSVIESFLESTLKRKGYKIINKGLILVVVKINPSDKSNPNRVEPAAATPKEIKESNIHNCSQNNTVMSLPNAKIDTFAQYIAKREGVAIAYANDAIKDMPVHLHPISLPVPADKFSDTINSILECCLELKGYRIVKTDKVWNIVKISDK